MSPTTFNGKICYLEIPAEDIARSSEFYSNVFGWKTRRRDNGSLAFDDGVGGVSGSWVTGRKPMSEVGLLFYVMVDNIESAIAQVKRAGCEITQPLGVDAPELTARFRDPAGNIVGLYEEPRR